MIDTAKMKRLREKRRLTQEEAAKLAGLAGRQQWNSIETGRAGGSRGISLVTLAKVAKALGVKPKDLLL